MGCGSSSQLIPVNDIQQTNTQQCVIIPTNANNELKHSETDISTLSSIEEDRVTVSQAVDIDVQNENNNHKPSKASDRLIKIQQEAKPEYNEQVLRDKRIVTEFKHKQQLRLKAQSENNNKEKIRREIIAAREFEKSQNKNPAVNIENSLNSNKNNITTETVDIMKRKEETEQVRERARLNSLMDESYNSYEEPIVIEHDRCFNQDTENFWEDSLQPDPLETEAPGSVITM